VSDFVEECRREWKRLRVPAGPAEEMADDLAADLHEAEAEGAFPEEVLGNGAADPRAFAEAWARERGLVRPHWTDRLRTRQALLVGVALVALLVVGAVLGSILSSTGPRNAAPAPAATQQSPAGGFVGGSPIVGTSIFSVRLLPVGVRLHPSVQLKHAINSHPTSIRTVVQDSGSTNVASVTLEVRVDHHTITRKLSGLRPSAQRRVTIPLPAGLPDHFTIRVRTLPLPGETNLTNNSATWRIAVRR
jgi:hypothetical protein